MKYIIIASAAIATIAVISGWFYKQQYDSEQRGVQKQINVNVAETNQRIAERRAQDASFDRNDVKRLCDDADLEWMWDEAKQRSFCQ